jgi:glycosyltransferase involved in cell wall biosynthesis
MERIEFKEHLLPGKVAEQLETPTMMLLPTRADVSPNAVKEAVVAGVPVVASNVGGIPDYVTPFKNGLLFTPGDLDQFVEAIRTAIKHPLFGRGQVEPASLASSRVYLSPARMAENFLAAYDRLLEKPGASG